MNPFLGMIALFGFNFAPRDWATCSGQLMQIRSNAALFALLGTQFGGDGTTTFALPDLRGRVPVGQGQGPGLSQYIVGQTAGSENVTLTSANLPAHTHNIYGTTEAGNAGSPEGAYPAGTGAFDREYRSASNSLVTMNAQMVASQGSNAPVSVLNPALALNYCIALSGIFPPRS